MRRRQVLAAFKAGYVVFVSGFLIWATWQAVVAAEGQLATLLNPAALVFVAAWILMAFMLGVGWAVLFRIYVGIDMSVGSWLPVQGAAWAGRYLPGKLGLMAGKMVLVQRDGVPWQLVAFSVLVEQLLFVASGACIALVVVWWPSEHIGTTFGWFLGDDWAPARWAVVLLVFVAFFPTMQFIARRMQVRTRPSIVEACGIWLLYGASHAAAGLGFHALLLELLPGAAPPVLHSIALLAAANVLGILAVFAPAGLGVREVVLVVGLTPYMPMPQAIIVAVILRLLTVIADLAFSLFAGGTGLLVRRGHTLDTTD
ncbi:hypothetical protein WCE34_03690 [Luteimonas sp. MJ204]|uniref:hypothetical protein n=1 Tax=Luteimonas sp. MJ145 TaxID=3129234 RepID=UPI0031BAF44D